LSWLVPAIHGFSLNACKKDVDAHDSAGMTLKRCFDLIGT
jgi:hypothetical protein